MKKILSFLVFAFLLFSCNEHKQPAIAFYYWKTVFNLSALEKNTLLQNNVKKLYLRYFDIDIAPQSQQPFPVSAIRFEQKTTGFTIVPVVYIKNNVMLNNNLDIKDLAQKTNDFIKQINKKNGISCQEIQVDCDWTLNSRDNYLKFIEAFKTIINKKLSVTIRLHQIKYFKTTKIPNADRGVLMYYNMGKIVTDSLNSIYDRKIAQRYLQSLKKYPLQLDVALPIYSWAIAIREQKIMGLKSKLDIINLKKDTNFIQTDKNHFKVKNPNYKKGTFYAKNDILKTETISENDLLEMASDLEENLATNPNEIIFYDLDQLNIKNYEKNIFKKIIARF